MIGRAAIALALSLAALPARADDLVRVNTFPNAKALPFHAGMAAGIFARHGIRLELAFTDNSKNQRDGLAAGKFDVAQAALDNAVAMIEVAKADVVIVVAGMEGALPSVVGGLVACPVIAVPTSVGYGASFDGIAALLTMLNSCSANVVTVNIDAGFKAGYVAALIAKQKTEGTSPRS